MKRKLIQFDTFKTIQEGSLSRAEEELIKAEDVLSEALGLDNLELFCFGESAVTYQTSDGSYIHATYDLNNKNLTLENLEELVIDEESEQKESMNVLSDMVEEILNKNNAKADHLFDNYMSLPKNRREFMEGYEEEVDEEINESNINEIAIKQLWGRRKDAPKEGPLARKKQNPSTIRKRAQARSRSVQKKTDAQKDFIKMKKDREKARHGGDWEFHARTSDFADKKKDNGKKMKKPNEKKLKDWAVVAENVAGYINYKEFGPILESTEFKHDDRGNITALRMPTSTVRNEGKILQFNWKTLETEVKVLRNKVKCEAQTQSFCNAMKDLRKANALSDAEKMDKIIEAVVGKWPNLLYLTQSELSANIGEALNMVGEVNWDDEVCEFFAEGILRKATEAYEERVNRIMRIAGINLQNKPEDVYETFKDVVNQFYPMIDETSQLEMQVYVDLYNTLVEVHNSAKSEGNELLKSNVSSFLRELHLVVTEQVEPTLEIAGDVVSFLYDLVETNLGTKSWDVSNSTYDTVNGDNPAMGEKARKGYSPASDFSGDFGDPAPVSDGAYKLGKGVGDAQEMRNRSWGNIGSDKEVFPSLKNPYVPGDPGKIWKMNEPNATTDGDDDWSRWQSKDTWPNLQNPNVPKAETPKSYKMKSDNLVVDQ